VSHPLLERLRSPDPEERCAACRDVGEDPAAILLVDGLVGALGDPVKAVAQAATDTLVKLAQDHDVIPSLRTALRDDDATRRLDAALALARLEPPHVRLVPALVDGLGLADAKRRWWATKLLVETGRLSPEVLPVLLGLSRGHDQPAVRRMARHALRELARDDPEAARALVEATRDPDIPARRAGYAALAAILAPEPAVVGRLTEALGSEPDPASRRIATVALAELASRDASVIDTAALQALETARASSDEGLQRGAARALAVLGR
jgi:hypothetical protein